LTTLVPDITRAWVKCGTGTGTGTRNIVRNGNWNFSYSCFKYFKYIRFPLSSIHIVLGNMYVLGLMLQFQVKNAIYFKYARFRKNCEQIIKKLQVNSASKMAVTSSTPAMYIKNDIFVKMRMTVTAFSFLSYVVHFIPVMRIFTNLSFSK